MTTQDNIEIASSDYWKSMTYSEAMLYCFALGEGWRLPSASERALVSDFLQYNYWCTDYQYLKSTTRLVVIPVRDLKDD